MAVENYPAMSLALLALIVFAANIVETVLGFGSTLIAVSLAAHLFPIGTLLPVLVPVNVVLSLYLVVRHRRHVDWAVLGRTILPFTLTGLAAGLAVFTLAQSQALRLGYGAFVTAVAAGSLVAQWRYRPAAPEAGEAAGEAAGAHAPLRLFPGAAALCLLGSGFFQGLFASGGPLMVVYAGRQFTSKATFRSTLAVVWSILATGMIITYAWTGKLTAATLTWSAGLLPVLGLAIVVGELLHSRADERAFRRIVLVMLLAAGLSLMVAPR